MRRIGHTEQLPGDADEAIRMIETEGYELDEYSRAEIVALVGGSR